MARQDGRLEPGQPLRGAISARAWNRALDAADLVLGDRYSVTAESGGGSGRSFTTAMGLNSVGRDLEIGDAVPISWSTYIAATSDLQDDARFSYSVNDALVCEMKSASQSVPYPITICVALEPIKQNKIGRVAVSGVVLAKVDTTNWDNGEYYPKIETQYPGEITGHGITNRRTTHLSFNADGHLCIAEIGPAVLVGLPKGSNGTHQAPESQPELCLIHIGHRQAATARIGFIDDSWEKDTSRVVFDAGRGLGEVETYTHKFVAWNYMRTLTAVGRRLVCCVLDGNMEWQLVAAAPNPDITDVITDIVLNQDKTVANITRKALY